ncbi:MAG: hypothetical protein CBC16_04370 [Verrucomicrobia bacterium TMED56]|nr:MAG: hypothetical protein CBC16_04370 [Verrucomicrobia bacterium TMED56]
MGIIKKCLVGGLFFSLVLLEAKVRFPARGFAKVLSDEIAQKKLAEYRSFILKDSNETRFHEGFAFRFNLRHMPRRGLERNITGSMYGPYLGSGLIRMELDLKTPDAAAEVYLLNNKESPELWKFKLGHLELQKISSADSLSPLVHGMNQTAFDLLMPFVFWEGEYKLSGKVAGRPAHIYSFKTPEWVTKEKPNWKRITLALDDAYHAPLRVEFFGHEQVAERTLLLRSFKKLKDRWIIKEIDCRDRLTRSVTRMKITSAALDLDFDASVFLTEGLRQVLELDSKLFLSTD